MNQSEYCDTDSRYSDYSHVLSLSNDNASSIFLAGGTAENLVGRNSFESEKWINSYELTSGNVELKKKYIDNCTSSMNISIDEILVTNGATAALYMSLKVLSLGKKE